MSVLDEHSAHPLFLPENPDEQYVFPHSISVIRCDRQWRQVDTSAELILASELRTARDIVEKFGGGWYELYGRNKRGQVMARRKIGPLPGKPKPMCDLAAMGIDDEELDPVPAAAVPPPAPAQPSTDMTALATLLLQSQRETRDFMAAMLQESKASAREAIERTEKFADRVMQMVTQTAQARIEAPVAQIQAQQPNQIEALLRGVQLATDLQAAMGDRSEGGGIEETINLFVQGMQALDKVSGKGDGSQGGPPPGTIPQ